jgi:hypothetical protein
MRKVHYDLLHRTLLIGNPLGGLSTLDRLSGGCLNLKPEAHTIPDAGMLILISQLKERL